MAALMMLAACSRTPVPPAPFGATPAERQLSWHDQEYYAFVHFNINTFSDLEWGHGTEPPTIFNPTQLDCRQWARIAKAAGMKGIIITAKHHDGFCLWPSAFTEHSVRNSPWRDGKGDVLRELSDACKEYGLKMGVYLSPWDRNNPKYGTPEYNGYFMQQLTEVLTGYGDIFEVWFDGANGEGPNGKKQEYDWPAFIETVRKNQPNAVIFSDAGPDIRWVGTEAGFANPTNWATLNRDDYFPGTPRYMDLRSGNRNGTHWLPAEVDVSIRPGWYYHKEEDRYVKSADHLELIYYQSVGRNANMLLNLPVDRRGLVHEADSAALMALKARLDATFSNNLTAGQQASADHIRQNLKDFAAQNAIDGNPETYWATDDADTTGSIEIVLDAPAKINVISLEEYIPLGQRVEGFNVEVWQDGHWAFAAEATTIGNKRLLRLPETTTDRVRVNITASMACPVISEIGLFYAPHPNPLLEPKVDFDKRMAWWRDARFGMFIHWGAYSIPAGVYKGKEIDGIGEWIMDHAKIPIPEYEKFVRQFNPVKFNAEEWVKIAKHAGMKYIVITSKHHDGFCIWDSKVSGYDIMDFAPFKRDILGELADACEKEGIKLCFYHSIMDWHHPDAKGENFPDYRDNYLKPQLAELVNNYNPYVLWFDGEWIKEWTEPQGKDLYAYVRDLNPAIIVNNRVGKGRNGMQGMNKGGEFVGDFGTPEQEILAHGGGDLDWESCMTMNDTWGFKKNDHNWKSAETLVHNLVDIVAKGGNYLLNVGPTSEGLIPDASVERLAEMGEWIKVNGEVIYGSAQWEQYQEGEHIRYIHGKDGSVYAVALAWPGEQLKLKYIKPDAGSAIRMLGTDQDLTWTWDDAQGLNISLPAALQAESARPCKYAWVFRIKGSAAKVTEAPDIKSGEKSIGMLNGAGNEIFTERITVNLTSPQPDSKVYLTKDGSTPTPDAAVYSSPVEITETTLLRAVAVAPGQVWSLPSAVLLSKSRFNGISLTNPFSGNYPGGGNLALIDGQRAAAKFRDPHWQGFEGVDLEAVIDLGKPQAISRIQLTCLQDIGAWIFSPTEVSFDYAVADGPFKTLSTLKHPIDRHSDNAEIIPFEARFAAVEADQVRVRARNVGTCPPWHGGAGGKAWLFADEVHKRI